jgi:hypothetical protein
LIFESSGKHHPTPFIRISTFAPADDDGEQLRVTEYTEIPAHILLPVLSQLAALAEQDVHGAPRAQDEARERRAAR